MTIPFNSFGNLLARSNVVQKFHSVSPMWNEALAKLGLPSLPECSPAMIRMGVCVNYFGDSGCFSARIFQILDKFA